MCPNNKLQKHVTHSDIRELHKIHEQVAITSLITDTSGKMQKKKKQRILMVIKPGQLEHQDDTSTSALANHLTEYYPSFKESEKQSITEANYRYSDRQHSTGDYSKVVLIYSKKVLTCIKDKWW